MTTHPKKVKTDVYSKDELQSKDLPSAIQALSANGISIDKTMQAPDGFKGYVGVYQGRKMPIYLLPDKKHVLIGSLFDAKAQDLTSISFNEASTPVYGEAEWQKLEKVPVALLLYINVSINSILISILLFAPSR